jgi:hypothetical protein
MKLVMIVGIALCLFPCRTTNAQSLTGNELQSKCKHAVQETPSDLSSSWSAGLCAGYISGVVDSQAMWEAFEHVEKNYEQFHYCMPAAATNEQALKIVVKYLDDHPERLHEPANILILEALHKAFPCAN